MAVIFAQAAMLPEGWRRDVRVDIDNDGLITAVQEQQTGADTEAAELVAVLIPGMPNVHCHAFQRALAGLTQRAGPRHDDFWSWREVMYRFLAELSPEQVEAIAAHLYVEMLKHGYKAVAELHYLHNDPAGLPYHNRAELADRIVAAARNAGIGLTLLPVLYQTGNFGGVPTSEGQRRFALGTEDFLDLLGDLHDRYWTSANIRIGAAPHSLRAVSSASLDALVVRVQGMRVRDPELPIHIHAAEQTKEVEDCIAWSGKRPVEWLLATGRIDRRWTLIHCTHMTETEAQALAASGAVAGLCPTTEADLGDGFFPLLEYLFAGGSFAIGSDSNVGTVPAEELRWLEYGQRLQRRRRNLVSATPGESIGARLWRSALAGGARSLAQPIGAIAPGRRADLVVLDPDHPTLLGRSDDRLIDSLVFAGATAGIRHVMVGGRWLVRDRHHAQEDAIAAAYRAALARLG